MRNSLSMFAVYMLTNSRRTVLYTGHTDDLARRIHEHKQKAIPGFTAKYNCDLLVWYEYHDSRDSALSREYSLKRWKRSWKEELIEDDNPDWRDLDLTDTLD